jgi:uncharacterized phage protein (TIGR02218 family)
VSRPISAGLAAHVAGTSRRLARMLRLDLEDGTTIAVTDHDRDIVFDLGDGAVTYSAATGVIASDLALSVGLDPNTCEVTGPIGDTVTRPAVLGERFNSADAWYFVVNWSNLAQGYGELMAGEVINASVIGGTFKFEVADAFYRFGQTIGELISNICRTTYGSAQCTLTPESTVGTVTAATDARRFTVSYPDSFATEYFNGGTAEATSGALAGTRRRDILSWTDHGATADILLMVPLAETPAIGDQFTIRRGCPRTITACIERNNVLNFRGEPDVPGDDKVMQMPLAPV